MPIAAPIRLPILTLLLAVCSGCATTVSDAPKDVRIQGQWSLDEAASDNAAVKIDAVIAKLEAKVRAQRPKPYPPSTPVAAPAAAGGDNTGPDGGTAGDNDEDEFDLDNRARFGGRRGPFIDFKLMRQRLQDAFSTPARLAIAVSPELVRITPQGLPGREYRPGESFSRIDDYGAGTISPGWSGDVFVLQATYTNRIARTERYAVAAGDNRLIITRQMNDPIAGKLTLQSVYRRID